jgi:hypothetical protein
VWLGTRNGKVYFFDGNQWQDQGQLDGSLIAALWGTARNNIWAVGNDDTLQGYNYRWFNGTAWGSGNPPNDAHMYGINGQSANWVWAVGMSGMITLYDGTGWNRLFSGETSAILDAVWGNGDGTVWVGGDDGIYALVP